MKRYLLGILTVILLLAGTVSAGAAQDGFQSSSASDYESGLTDTAQLLDSSEEEAVVERIAEISQEYDTEVVMMLLDDYKTEYPEYDSYTDMSDPFNFIEEYYYRNYNDSMGSGIILLVSMEERDWALCRFGDAKEAIDDDYGYEYITSHLKERLGDGDYEEACEGFLEDYDTFMRAWDEGEPYSEHHTYKTAGTYIKYFGIAIGISVILALIVVLVMKSGMNTAKPKPGAREYVKKDSFVLSNQQDLYLYSRTTKTAIPKDSGSGGSSGGSHSGSHGGSGGSGKF